MLKNNNKGQILSELLVAIAIGVTLAAIGAQLLSVSLNASKISKNRNEALGLAQEGIEAMRAIIRGNDASSQGWNRVYLPPDGAGSTSTAKGMNSPYHPEVIGNAWQLASSSENIVINGETYTRKIIIENVCRNNTTGNVSSTSPCAGGASDDPATQKVTVIVSKSGDPDVQLESYFSRVLNESTLQTDWSGAINDGPFSATSTTTNVGNGTDNSSIIDRTINIKLKQ